MIVSLPMYDWPELRNEHDALWEAIRAKLAREGMNAPVKLSRGKNEPELWLSPDLLLGQTCGYPFATVLRDKVRYVATPVYSAKGCTGTTYSSAIVVNANSSLSLEKLAGTSFAFNTRMSLSGYRVMWAMTGRPQDYFAALIETGSHRQSARHVADGRADVAALDAVCWQLLHRHEAATAERLRVIGWSAMWPSLPLITSLKTSQTEIDRLVRVLREVFSEKETAAVRAGLMITGCKIVDLSQYQMLSAIED